MPGSENGPRHREVLWPRETEALNIHSPAPWEPDQQPGTPQAGKAQVVLTQDQVELTQDQVVMENRRFQSL